MKLLDLFCGAGGSSMGYYLAGFDEIVGVDIECQPHYPFDFVCADALDYQLDGFDVIHASPPCQLYSKLRGLTKRQYPDLVAHVRARMKGHSYVIENVPGAPLLNPIMLCGTMFGLRVLRHRLFEISPNPFEIRCFDLLRCEHKGKTQKRKEIGSFNKSKYISVVGGGYIANDGREAMAIDWMTKKELSQAIPPAYTHYIGEKLIEKLKA